MATQTMGSAPRYLWGPYADVILLGGGSLLLLPLFRWLIGGGEEAVAWSLATTLALANLINHPHFAHSYQIFYSSFGQKLFSPTYEPSLRLRYWLVGVAAPVLICLAMFALVYTESARALGMFANLMFFMVGWHYVKQGYGMAMVDAVLKRAFFSDREKRLLLVNAYAVWIASWAWINVLLAKAAPAYWGIEYFVVPVPVGLTVALFVVMSCTTLALCTSLFKRWRRGERMAWVGLLAYVVSLYVWLLVRDPVVLLWIPAFHSLQYLAVVWRYELNRLSGKSSHGVGLRFAFFVVAGFGLGYLGFWLVPEWLGSVVPYNRELFGPALFFFLSWIFINTHHYLLDTVMWRKGNPDVARNLFR